MTIQKIIFTLLCIFTLQVLYAQAFYVKLGGGYSWPGLIKSTTIKGFQPGNNPEPTAATIVDMMNIIDTGTSKRSYYPIRDSYGRGFNLSVSAGYMFNKWIGAELNFVFLQSARIRSSQLSSSSLLLGNGATTLTKTYARGLSIIPAIHLQLPIDKWKVYPYSRLGLSIPVAGIIKHEIEIDAPNPNTLLFPGAASLSSKVAVRTTAKFSIGFVGAIGIVYPIKKNIQIWCEVNAQMLDVRAKHSKVTEYEIRKTDAQGTSDVFIDLEDYPNTYSREVWFVNQLTDMSNNSAYNTHYNSAGENYDKSKPKEELQQSVPFHNIGLAIGITYKIPRRSRTTTPSYNP